MFNAKNYSDKLPKNIRQPLQQFAGNDCLLVKRSIDNLGLETQQGNCHINVKGYVEAFGGEMVNGWLLYRNRKLLDKGMWVWCFHSMWLTEEKELLDVTEDECYQNNAFSTFIPDVARKVNLDEGINYNNIAIFENEAFAQFFGNSIGANIKVGAPYWISEDMLRVKDLTEHTGEYRWLHEEYKQNQLMLLQKYGVAIVDDKLLMAGAANDEISADLLFDFSLSCAA